MERFVCKCIPVGWGGPHVPLKVSASQEEHLVNREVAAPIK